MNSQLKATGEHARAARIVAETDLELLAAKEGRDEVIETMIVGTVLGDALFAAMRRIAHTEVSGKRFKSAPEAPDSGC
ncbi:MAG TPA: hypothetical protein VFU12_00460 [Glycomyces sp.]|nr:hypothetical protein [Glycomyces sp.]